MFLHSKRNSRCQTVQPTDHFVNSLREVSVGSTLFRWFVPGTYQLIPCMWQFVLSMASPVYLLGWLGHMQLGSCQISLERIFLAKLIFFRRITSWLLDLSECCCFVAFWRSRNKESGAWAFGHFILKQCVNVTTFFLDDRMMRMPWRRRWSRSRK